MAAHIDIVSDVICPWCYIGTTRLERVLTERGAAVEVAYHPFFLDPTVPPGGRVIADWLRARYGRDPAPMFARVEAEAKKGGLDLDLSRQPRAYPTARAHALIGAAGPRNAARAVARALFAAYFDDGLDISDPEVLAAIGAAHGFTHDEARAAVADEARLAEVAETAQSIAGQGIGGVPFFVFRPDGAEAFALSGAQPLEVFTRAVEQLLAPAPTS